MDQILKLNEISSNPKKVQGTALEPILFSIYVIYQFLTVSYIEKSTISYPYDTALIFVDLNWDVLKLKMEK